MNVQSRKRTKQKMPYIDIESKHEIKTPHYLMTNANTT